MTRAAESNPSRSIPLDVVVAASTAGATACTGPMLLAKSLIDVFLSIWDGVSARLGGRALDLLDGLGQHDPATDTPTGVEADKAVLCDAVRVAHDRQRNAVEHA